MYAQKKVTENRNTSVGRMKTKKDELRSRNYKLNTNGYGHNKLPNIVNQSKRVSSIPNTNVVQNFLADDDNVIQLRKHRMWDGNNDEYEYDDETKELKMNGETISDSIDTLLDAWKHVQLSVRLSAEDNGESNQEEKLGGEQEYETNCWFASLAYYMGISQTELKQKTGYQSDDAMIGCQNTDLADIGVLAGITLTYKPAATLVDLVTKLLNQKVILSLGDHIMVADGIDPVTMKVRIWESYSGTHGVWDAQTVAVLLKEMWS